MWTPAAPRLLAQIRHGQASDAPKTLYIAALAVHLSLGRKTIWRRVAYVVRGERLRTEQSVVAISLLVSRGTSTARTIELSAISPFRRACLLRRTSARPSCGLHLLTHRRCLGTLTAACMSRLRLAGWAYIPSATSSLRFRLRPAFDWRRCPCACMAWLDACRQTDDRRPPLPVPRAFVRR
jgi:hypothetical protein